MPISPHSISSHLQKICPAKILEQTGEGVLQALSITEKLLAVGGGWRRETIFFECVATSGWPRIHTILAVLIGLSDYKKGHKFRENWEKLEGGNKGRFECVLFIQV